MSQGRAQPRPASLEWLAQHHAMLAPRHQASYILILQLPLDHHSQCSVGEAFLAHSTGARYVCSRSACSVSCALFLNTIMRSLVCHGLLRHDTQLLDVFAAHHIWLQGLFPGFDCPYPTRLECRGLLQLASMTLQNSSNNERLRLESGAALCCSMSFGSSRSTPYIGKTRVTRP